MTVAAFSTPRKAMLAWRLPDADWLIAAGAALAMLALAMFGPGFLNDGDTTWHLAAGNWMMAHGQVPRTDPFSFTFAGQPWQAHEWLSEVLMAGAFDLAGWTGLVVLFGLVLAGSAFLLTSQLNRSLTGVGLLLAVVLALACAAPSLLARLAIDISLKGNSSPGTPCGVTAAASTVTAANRPQSRTTFRRCSGLASISASRPRTPSSKTPNT